MDRQNQEIVRLCNEEIVDRLLTYRRILQEEMEPDDWAKATCPMIAMLSDVCDHLCLSPGQRARVLGVHDVVLLDLPGGWVPVLAAEVVG